MCTGTQEDMNQEINNGVMAAGEDRNNPLSPAKGNVDRHLLSLPTTKSVTNNMDKNSKIT